jgi:DNA mismatch repair protein MutL
MSQIRILPPILRNKIAAGEVIERPASVVKELIENSIDAGSTDIRIEILYGGKRLMKVSDNGNGMDKEDALLCGERYATSKLIKEEDLLHIMTMGFRGEALPSITSVAKVKLVTAPKGSHKGVSVEIHGGEVKSVKDSPSVGTTVEVRDLFFNTPVRKKFLKGHNTETFHIIDRVTEQALAHHEIGFSLVSDNHEIMRIPVASSLRERVMQIYGDEFLGGLIETSRDIPDIIMTCFISKETNLRNSKTYQFIFINKRPIRDPSLTHAVYNAYEGILPPKKHPVFFLFLMINPAVIDVNVHPAKREVRFENKEPVYHFVLSVIRDALPQPVHPSPYGPPSPSVISEALDLEYETSISFIPLGDAFIALSGRGGLTLVDQHAAHERILYERFLRGVDLNSHPLLFPKQVQLSHKEYHMILTNSLILKDFGIETDDFGHNTVIVRSLPEVLRDADIRGILADIASCLIEGIAPDRELKEALAAKIACHQSVRGKTILKQEEVEQLLSDLQKCLHPDNCPHGRPTKIFFSLEDLKRMFKRT